MSTDKYHVDYRTQVVGPFSLSELESRIDTDKHRNNPPISKNGAEWVDATQLPELAACLRRKQWRELRAQIPIAMLVLILFCPIIVAAWFIGTFSSDAYPQPVSHTTPQVEFHATPTFQGSGGASQSDIGKRGIEKFVAPSSEVMTEEYRRAVTREMVKEGADPAEAEAFTKALNDAQRNWERRK